MAVSFATLYTGTRLCLFLALVVAPLVGSALDGPCGELFDHRVRLAGWTIHLEGVRLTLGLGGLVILGAGLLARAAVRADQPLSAPAESGAPALGSPAAARPGARQEAPAIGQPAVEA